MLEINVTIHCPELLALAEALSAGKAPAPAAPAPTAAPAPMPPTAASAPMTAPVAPVAPVAAPTYTVQDITLAGANLIRDNPATQPQLTGLLQQFGVPAASALRPEQLAPFAAALKSLGARL